MRGKRVLILGGTREAREVADLLVKRGAGVVTSLAGVTRNPAASAGDRRSGGFGGVDGLAAYLASEHFDAIIDATHPFAVQISSHAAYAASRSNIPIVRVERPPWRACSGDHWLSFPDCASAAEALGGHERVLLTIGRKELASFFARPALTGVARMIEPPEVPAPAGWKIVLGRPPFALADELALIDGDSITILITKNSGGEDTRAKLDAARLRGIPVHMIERPRKADVDTVPAPAEVFPLLASLLWA